MNKLMYLFGSMGAVLLFGCSSDNESSIIIEEEKETVVTDRFNNEMADSAVGVYEIDNAFQLKLLAERVNRQLRNADSVLYAECRYKLTDDIDMSAVCGDTLGSWVAIGTVGNAMADSVSFNGYFDGNHHSVSNLYVGDDATSYCQVGLFGSIMGATVENLHVSGHITVGGFSQKQVDNIHIGGVVALASGSVIRNCTSDVAMDIAVKLNPDSLNTTDRNKWRVGGVVGLAWKSSESTVIDGCAYSGNIRVTNGQPQPVAILTIGGVCGGLSTSNSSIVSNCYNTGTVTESNDGGVCLTYVGGVMGSSSVNDNNNNLYNCYNTGMVEKATETEGSGVGGVVGYIAKGNTVGNVYTSQGNFCGNAKGVTENCYSSDDLYGEIYGTLNQWVELNGSETYHLWLETLAFIK